MTAGVQITPPSGKLQMIFFLPLSLSPSVTLGKSRAAPPQTASKLLLGIVCCQVAGLFFCYFNSICRCLFTHVVFIIPPPAGHPCPPSALEHGMSSLSCAPTERRPERRLHTLPHSWIKQTLTAQLNLTKELGSFQRCSEECARESVFVHSCVCVSYIFFLLLSSLLPPYLPPSAFFSPWVKQTHHFTALCKKKKKKSK